MLDNFSVVTPNLNMGRYLEETIDSVLRNLSSDDEYFIVDGGSRDKSVEIIRSYEKYLTGWISEPDKGYAEAIAKGFKQCRGKFLCWINSGDLLLNGALKTAGRTLIETGADLIFGDDVCIDEQNKVILFSSGYVRSLHLMLLYGGWTPLQDACFWRRSLYERIGGINPEIRFAADYDFFLRASLTGRYVYIPKVFSAFRRHDNQKSIQGASSYTHERLVCRRHILQELCIPIPSRFIATIYYTIKVHWRHHILRRFHRSPIPIGTLATDLFVT